MRPFKFFFGIAIAAMVFLFVLKFIIPAVLIAGVLTLVYHLFRKVSYFIQSRSWEQDSDRYEHIPTLSFEPRNRYAYESWREPAWKMDARTITIQ